MLPKIQKLPRGEVRKFRIDDRLRIASVQDASGYNIFLGRPRTELEQDYLILLGKVIEMTRNPNYSNANVWLDVGKPHVVFIVGRRGKGKSYDLGIITEGLTLNASSKISSKEETVSTIVFDTMNQFWSSYFEPSKEDPEEAKQIKLLKKWGLDAKALTTLRLFVPRGTTKLFPFFEELTIKPSELNDNDWCNLFGFDKYSDLPGQLLASSYRKVTQDGYYTSDGDFVKPKKDYIINDLVYCIENDRDILSETRGFKIETRRAIIQRLREAEEWKVFSEKGLDISEIYRAGQASVIMIGELDDNAKALLCGLIVRKVYDLRASTRSYEEKLLRLRGILNKATNTTERSETEKEINRLLSQLRSEYHPPSWILIDEAHVMCPQVGKTSAKPALIKVARRGRDKGLSLVLATQRPSAIDKTLISQKDILIIHQLGIEADRKTAKAQVGTTIPKNVYRGNTLLKDSFEEIITDVDTGEAFVADDEASRCFLMKVRPRLSAHGGKEANQRRVMQILGETSAK